MREWIGEISEEQLGPEDRLIRKCVMKLHSEGGCDGEVAERAVRELVAQLRELDRPTKMQQVNEKLTSMSIESGLGHSF